MSCDNLQDLYDPINLKMKTNNEGKSNKNTITIT